MRRVFAYLLTFILIFSCLPFSVAAASDVLTIDNAHRYDGMNQTYAQGYLPIVSGGKASIVLPLISDIPLENNRINVALGLGDTSSAPFIYNSYNRDFSLEDHAVDDGTDTVSTYLVSFELPLKSNRVNGVYPVTVTITAKTADGNPISQAYTLYTTVTDGIDSNQSEEPPAEEGEEAPTSSPKLIVSTSTTEPDEIKAGDNLKTLVTIKNTSSIKAVQNITVKVSSSSEDVLLENDSTTFYFSNLDAGKTLSIDLMLRSTLNVKPGRYFLNFDISYDDMKATPLTSSETVAIDIGQHFNVVLETPQIDKDIYAGDTIPLEFKVINMGRSAVHNVQCELTGFGLFPDGSAYFGSLEAESESSKEINIFIGSLDMSEGYTGTDKYGFTEGTITLTYEDDDGTEYSGTYTIQTTIKAAEVPEETEETDTVGQWWVSVLIVMILVSVSGGYLLWRRKCRIKTYEEK